MALSNAERQKAYRERKKAEKALKELDQQAPKEVQEEICNELMLQVPQGPISALSPSAMKLMEGQERYREEFQQEPVFVHQVPPPVVVEGNPDDLPPVKIEQETLTYFDVYKRRHDGMFK